MWPVDGATDSTKIQPFSRDVKDNTAKYLCLYLFILQVMSETGADSTEVYKNPPTEAPQVSTVVQVTMAAPSVQANIFTGTLQVILGFTNTQVWVLVDNGYDRQESVLY